MSCSSRLPPVDTQARWQPKNRAIDPLTTPQHHATLFERHRRGSCMKREPINPDSVYSREEAAELLGVSLSTVKRLIAAGQLIASRPESIRRIFIQGSSILQMLEETKIEVDR